MTTLLLLSCQDKSRLVKPTFENAHVLVNNDEFHFGILSNSMGEVSHVFTLINDGKEPLYINSVENMCHCTHVEYDKEPVRPGHGLKLKVLLNIIELTPGYFSRSVVVNTNAGSVSFNIMGEKKD